MKNCMTLYFCACAATLLVIAYGQSSTTLSWKDRARLEYKKNYDKYILHNRTPESTEPGGLASSNAGAAADDKNTVVSNSNSVEPTGNSVGLRNSLGSLGAADSIQGVSVKPAPPASPTDTDVVVVTQPSRFSPPPPPPPPPPPSQTTPEAAAPAPAPAPAPARPAVQPQPVFSFPVTSFASSSASAGSASASSFASAGAGGSFASAGSGPALRKSPSGLIGQVVSGLVRPITSILPAPLGPKGKNPGLVGTVVTGLIDEIEGNLRVIYPVTKPAAATRNKREGWHILGSFRRRFHEHSSSSG